MKRYINNIQGCYWIFGAFFFFSWLINTPFFLLLCILTLRGKDEDLQAFTCFCLSSFHSNFECRSVWSINGPYWINYWTVLINSKTGTFSLLLLHFLKKKRNKKNIYIKYTIRPFYCCCPRFCGSTGVVSNNNKDK